MLRIAICDDNRADVERLETVLDELCCYSVYCLYNGVKTLALRRNL